MAATTLVANTSAGLVGKTLATVESPPPFPVYTVAPAAPANGTGWFLYTAGAPGSMKLQWRLGGVTYELDLGSV